MFRSQLELYVCNKCDGNRQLYDRLVKETEGLDITIGMTTCMSRCYSGSSMSMKLQNGEIVEYNAPREGNQSKRIRIFQGDPVEFIKNDVLTALAHLAKKQF